MREIKLMSKSKKIQIIKEMVNRILEKQGDVTFMDIVEACSRFCDDGYSVIASYIDNGFSLFIGYWAWGEIVYEDDITFLVVPNWEDTDIENLTYLIEFLGKVEDKLKKDKLSKKQSCEK